MCVSLDIRAGDAGGEVIQRHMVRRSMLSLTLVLLPQADCCNEIVLSSGGGGGGGTIEPVIHKGWKRGHRQLLCI